MTFVPQINRLILIGNGFDLAHNLKTGYNDFIKWYMKNAFVKSCSDGSYGDGLVQVVRNNGIDFPNCEMDSPEKFINFFYHNGYTQLLKKHIIIDKSGRQVVNPFDVKFAPFFQTLLENCSESKWVEIEKDYYSALKTILKNGDRSSKLKLLNSLNSEMKQVIYSLKSYLTEIGIAKADDTYIEILKTHVIEEDLVGNFPNDRNKTTSHTLLLSFNYTSIPRMYIESNLKVANRQFSLIPIHGELIDLENPIIFGFGDELDENYLKMQNEEINAFFKYIKSFWYFHNSNYHNLIRFIDNDVYQVSVLGHSCGLSDRTMLNMIFEHKNCISIKIYYHGTKELNNYTELTQEISRHFNDKILLRRRIVPFSRSSAMPQVAMTENN